MTLESNLECSSGVYTQNEDKMDWTLEHSTRSAQVPYSVQVLPKMALKCSTIFALKFLKTIYVNFLFF